MKEQEAKELPPPERLVSGSYSIVSQLTDPTSLFEPVEPVPAPTSPASFQSERISLDDCLDEKAAAMPPPLQRNVSIHEQKGYLLQSPGAVSIIGSTSTSNETQDIEEPSQSGSQQDDQEQPSYEGSYTTTAIAISNEDLESEIRGRILQNAVQASHIQAEKPGHQKRNLGMVVCLAIAAILAAILVTRLVLIKPDTDELLAVPTFSPQPTIAPSTPLPTQRPTLSPTFAPTAAPTTDRNRVLAEYLRPLTFDQGESMDRPGTPQSNAFRTVVSRRNLYPGEDLVTTYALLVLYESMQGSRWTNNTNWYSGLSVCSWHGVTCKPSSQIQRRRLMQPEGKGDNDGMNVAALRLSNNQLLGTIPPEVALLPLEVLDLSRNHLVDSIPEQLKHLKQMKYLNLEGNQLYGTIPDTWCTEGVVLLVDCATVACSCCVPDCSLVAPAAAPVAAGPVAAMLPTVVTAPSLLATPTSGVMPNLPSLPVSVPTSAVAPSPVATPVLPPLAAPVFTVPTVPVTPTSPSLPMAPTSQAVPTLPSLPTVATVPSPQTIPTVPTTQSVPTVPMPQTVPTMPTTQTVPTPQTTPTLPNVPTPEMIPAPQSSPQAQPAVPVTPVLFPTPVVPTAPQVISTTKPAVAPVTPTAGSGTPAPTFGLNPPVNAPVQAPALAPVPSPILITVPEDGFPAPTRMPVRHPPTIIPPFSVPAQLPVYASNAPPALAPSIPTIPTILQQPILQPTLNLVPSQIAILAPYLPPQLKPALPKVEWSPVRPPVAQPIPNYDPPTPVSAPVAVPVSPIAPEPAPALAPARPPSAGSEGAPSLIQAPSPVLIIIPEGAPNLIEAPSPVQGATTSSVPTAMSPAPVTTVIEEETPTEGTTDSPTA
ncbi:hypothetical protein FisN_14Lh365 [Fistulifera solaris]|uniref:Leucine-rich repeat-containing N-terminal plant-type domain-containing protein n=1 Tax=Fistulifera solaris TaxID=1519565 RepID=A0A1Z5JIE9_FISSO|nr:hypothetical protein FisN_14Lh365 [Fistulifera solaris]|eukprot:GAX13622.1 hypothetical protein FisN_14Lh365 [Fistulifera solaris]